MRKIIGAFVFAVAVALAIGALGALGNQIWMGGSGGGAWRTMSGDATMTNAGVITISAGAVGNSKLANASTTVNGQTCTLGAGCTITASATSITIGSTTITSGTSGRVLYDVSGVVGELTTLGSGSVFLTSDANVAFLDVAQQFTKPQGVKLVTPAISTSTFTLDLSQGQDFLVVLVHASCPCTVNFSNPPAYPQHGVLEIDQSSTGSDTVGTWGGSGPTVIYGGGVSTISLTSSANAQDFFSYDSLGGSKVLLTTAALNATH